MLRLIATYVATALAVLALDIVWLTQFGPKVYFPTLDAVAMPTARLAPAAVFYFVYIAGILALAIWPTRDKPLIKTTVTGAMLGGLCYATYDLTNQATLKVWATHITLIDITWGTFLTAVGATVGGLVIRRMRA
ncbi:MAG: DUF2177 family protein [Alphaproteobacteria bacterium]|nr:DUF2177 family protein [Alphaproteobacteria bacterium]MBU1515118.1 DUF2177 family protein [Alphaproteobacteria bacterium]MBU2093476.1 DUF2177 family protein [Alphaproteobacteria bacterium]MBU2152324.1 DUF2177 family protein [Alphaproteobacteria bacterium]MBU2308138.1 DUF2177 family protein [Alphaproteobacteria bacterium]